MSESNPLANPPVYVWPNLEADRVAIDLALEELGDNASLQTIVIRAQAIKEELLRTEKAGAN